MWDVCRANYDRLCPERWSPDIPSWDVPPLYLFLSSPTIYMPRVMRQTLILTGESARTRQTNTRTAKHRDPPVTMWHYLSVLIKKITKKKLIYLNMELPDTHPNEWRYYRAYYITTAYEIRNTYKKHKPLKDITCRIYIKNKTRELSVACPVMPACRRTRMWSWYCLWMLAVDVLAIWLNVNGTGTAIVMPAADNNALS